MILTGNALQLLKTLPSESVQCCVTSPPYFGLRDYGVPDQIGNEEDPKEFVEKLVAVFREVRRILKKDGTLWLNIGDSYAGGGFSPGSPCNIAREKGEQWGKMNSFKPAQGENRKKPRPGHVPEGCKPKDLIGIPWMLAFALRSDGWYLRQDLIWHKPNPMPESVKDRCTKAHEYIFLFSKSPKYFFDSEAMQEDGVIKAGTRAAKGSNVRSESEGVNSRPPEYWIYDGKRNKRSVWTIQTRPFKGAHFATFPPEIPRLCISAGSKEGDTILDPFLGAGTTGLVALELKRDFIGIELNPEYSVMAHDRIYGVEAWME